VSSAVLLVRVDAGPLLLSLDGIEVIPTCGAISFPRFVRSTVMALGASGCAGSGCGIPFKLAFPRCPRFVF